MISRQSGLALLLTVLLIASGTVAVAGIGAAQTATAAGTAQGEPDLDVHLPQDTVMPGERSQIDLQISNDGEMEWGTAEYHEIVTSARNVRVETEAEGPLEVQGGEMAVGTITTNEPRDVPLTLKVPEGTEPGTYEIDVDLEYSYTDILWIGSTRVDEDTEQVTRTVEVEVDDAPRFSIENATTDVRIGDQGSMAVTLANTGSQTAEDIRLALESASGKFLFGQAQADTSRVETLEPGENATLGYDVTVPPGASLREFSLAGTVQYTDPDGLPGAQEGLSVGVRPLPEQTFDVETTESTLRIGEEGELRGTVTNTGPEPVQDVVVQYADESTASIVPVETKIAVGDLEPGASTDFALPLEVTTSGKAVTHSLDLAVTYRNADNEKRAYKDVNAAAAVDERRDQFEVVVEDETIQAGEDRTIEATITNQLDEEVSNVDVKLFVDDPLDSADDEGYIGSLSPGASRTVTLELSATGEAVPKVHPADFHVKYEDADGTSKISNTVTVPITVTTAEDTGIGWMQIALVGLLLVLVIGGLWYWRG
ncbi:NEW3 domain-containing protein [Halodesulfurarchaeum sp. HSR-GB]|uniref:COG1361 S-layer family protein n=1 Tax=Halodesulfurarchaeum sp. HSR-GB TaxID=3074077 RepID=UPI002864043E|nr:NEW3 domain-containing protein [Halodesulfurarchaeum sp. HSR-GB]MDR5656684.1 NEW3 domain-containing protein [Halodesulfurarchaeum sp. HSR-GB]